MPVMELPTPVIISDADSKTNKAMHWKVVLHNCDCHSFRDVEDALVKVIKCSLEKAKEFARKVHEDGQAVVYVGHKEPCEFKHFHLKNEGLEVELTQ